jgi:hypothetical protein
MNVSYKYPYSMTDGRSWILAHEIAGALNLAYTQVDTNYQELDLSKMNREGNYQSLRVNVQVMTTTNIWVDIYWVKTRGRDVENNSLAYLPIFSL